MNDQGFEKEVAIMAEYFQVLNEKASNVNPSDQQSNYYKLLSKIY